MFISIMTIIVIIISHHHYYYHNNLCHNHYLVQSTRTGWKRTIFCAQMGVAGRALQPNIRIPRQRHFHYHDRQQHFSVIIIVTIIILREGTFIHRHFKEISEICCIHIYIYTLSYLQYIHRYTIHTIYTDIYIPTIYTNIYKYIQLYTNIYVKLWCATWRRGGWYHTTPHKISCETQDEGRLLLLLCISQTLCRFVYVWMWCKVLIWTGIDWTWTWT